MVLLVWFILSSIAIFESVDGTFGRRRSNGPAPPAVRAIPMEASDIQMIVEQHNRWRAEVVPPSKAMFCLGIEEVLIKRKKSTGLFNSFLDISNATWSETLARQAAAEASMCPFNPDSFSNNYMTTMSNSPKPGQNFFGIQSKKTSNWKGVIKQWQIRGSSQFKYGVGGIDNQDVRHYVQLVTGSTREVGCASAYCYEDTYRIFICKYGPVRPLTGINPNPYMVSPVQSCDGCLDGVCETSGVHSGKLLLDCKNISNFDIDATTGIRRVYDVNVEVEDEFKDDQLDSGHIDGGDSVIIEIKDKKNKHYNDDEFDEILKMKKLELKRSLRAALKETRDYCYRKCDAIE